MFPIDIGIGIGIGIGQRPGEFSLAIRVKKRIPQLEMLLQRIVALANNEVNILETGEIRPFNSAPDVAQLQSVCRPLIIGCSVAPCDVYRRHARPDRPAHQDQPPGVRQQQPRVGAFGHRQGRRRDHAAGQDRRRHRCDRCADGFCAAEDQRLQHVDAAIAVPDPAIALSLVKFPALGPSPSRPPTYLSRR